MAIREFIEKSLILGNKKFALQVETSTKQRVTARKPGRRRNSKNNQ